jgi:molybdate transport system regulatory protein
MSVRKGKLEYTFGLYLNADGRRVIGEDGAEILEAVEEYGSIAAAAKKLEISYKFTWNCLLRMTRSLRQPVVVTRRGTTRYARRKGGGGTTLTPVARALLKEFRETERFMQQVLARREVPRRPRPQFSTQIERRQNSFLCCHIGCSESVA